MGKVLTEAKPFLFVIPGTRDKEYIKYINLVMMFWRLKGYDFFVQPMEWDDREDFKVKLDRAVDNLKEKQIYNRKAKVLGLSAGGSAAVNLLAYYPHLVDRVVNVCGALSFSDDLHYTSKSFGQSVEMCQKAKEKLDYKQRRNVMTMRPRYGDNVVPPKTVTLEGAVNVELPSTGHGLTIALALTAFSGRIESFLK